MTIGALGRWLIVVAIGLATLGLLLVALDRLGVGRLPGDFVWRRDGVTVYLPIGMMILVSILITILLDLLLRR